MLVTERAGEMLSMILRASQTEACDCIRLDLSSAHEGLRVDHESLGDEIVEYEGRKLLAMDPYTAETCARQILDCEEGRFVLTG